MRFFSKKDKETNGFIINTDDEAIKISGSKNLNPDAMTPDEVSNLWVLSDNTPDTTSSNALDSLKKRMNVTETQGDDKLNEKQDETTIPKEPDEQSNVAENIAKQPIDNNSTNTASVKPSLIEKVKRYTVDEQGHNVTENQKPLYELESVAEILLNDSKNAIEDLSKKYGIEFVVDKSNKTKDEPVTKEEFIEPKLPKSKKSGIQTPAFEKMVSDSEARESRELYESLFADEKKANPIKEVTDISVPDISDIDTAEIGINSEPPISNTATIRFTPIKDTKGNTDHIAISSVTKYIDLGDNIPEDISSHSSPELEQSDFDDFTPASEYVDAQSGKRILHLLAKQKRACFLSAFISAIVIIALSVFLIPPVYDNIISNPKSTMFVCSAFLSAAIIANIDMFLDFKYLFKQRSRFDILTALCSVMTLSLGITAALTQSNAYYIILLCAIILFSRILCKFSAVCAKQNNLKKIVGDTPKNAVTLINDPATTFAMVKNSIEGDVLVAAHRKTSFVEDFMKYYEYNKTLSGKTASIFYTTLVLSMVCGLVAYFYYDSIFTAVFAATIISCLAAIPTAFFIDTMPLSSASKKLNVTGAMIAGVYGAEKIENANAAIVNINDIFPAGTITMHNMKVLSNNNIDDILLRAASLTAAVGSPLHPIFKKIAGTNTSYSIPDSDTVKYEKNLGISGWVDNEPMFIGNRSLMKAHGIEIPSLEVDKKILRKGYFPVYVATSSAACALVVIQYNIDPIVAKQLHKITDLGVLLLVENCDPNVNEQMICDYFGLFDDSVKIVTNAGLHMYKNATPEVASCPAPAVFRGSGLDFIKIINCASSIKKCNRLLTILYVLFAVLGALYFVYAAFSGLMSMPQQTTVLLYILGTSFLSIIGFLIRKP